MDRTFFGEAHELNEIRNLLLEASWRATWLLSLCAYRKYRYRAVDWDRYLHSRAEPKFDHEPGTFTLAHYIRELRGGRPLRWHPNKSECAPVADALIGQDPARLAEELDGIRTTLRESIAMALEVIARCPASPGAEKSREILGRMQDDLQPPKLPWRNGYNLWSTIEDLRADAEEKKAGIAIREKARRESSIPEALDQLANRVEELRKFLRVTVTGHASVLMRFGRDPSVIHEALLGLQPVLNIIDGNPHRPDILMNCLPNLIDELLYLAARARKDAAADDVRAEPVIDAE